MAKVTALQELINYMQNLQDDNFISDIEYVIEKAKFLLYKEREQTKELLSNAWDASKEYNDWWDDENPEPPGKEEYIDNTLNK